MCLIVVAHAVDGAPPLVIAANRDERHAMKSCVLLAANRLHERGSIFAISNGPGGESWPKMERAVAAMRDALRESDTVEPLMRFLTTRTGGDRRDELFIVDPVHGTRASTVIVFGADGFLRYDERNFDPSGGPK